MDDHLYRELYERASYDRRAKADSFRFRKDKILSIGVWSLLCYALQKEGIMKFSVEVNENGKPCLAGIPDICFSLSHSGCMAMCALAEQEVGCDVEKKEALDPALAEYAMTKEELKRIYSLKDPQKQEEMFFRIWTLKESYMKATGLGMRLAPHDFEISFTAEKISVCNPKNDRRYFLKEYYPDDGYCYSCCSLSEQFAKDMIRVDLKKL